MQTATLKAQVTFVNVAVAISALAGEGAKNGFAPSPDSVGVSGTSFGRSRRYGDGILARFGRFPATEKTDKKKRNTANSHVFKECGMLEH